MKPRYILAPCAPCGLTSALEAWETVFSIGSSKRSKVVPSSYFGFEKQGGITSVGKPPASASDETLNIYIPFSGYPDLISGISLARCWTTLGPGTKP